MSVKELQVAISELAPQEFTGLLQWMQQMHEEAWDRQIAQDVKSGRFEALRERVREQRDAGECQPV